MLDTMMSGKGKKPTQDRKLGAFITKKSGYNPK